MAKYAEIYASLRDRIRSGELNPGDRLPTDRELCERYGVSRITATRAVQDLVRDGFVRRVPGSGTFVNEGGGALRTFHLLLPNLSTPYYSQMAIAFAHFFSRLGDVGACVLTDYKVDYTQAVLTETIRRGTDGVGIIPSGRPDWAETIRRAVASLGVPIVIGSRALPEFKGRQVIVDEADSAGQAVRHLVALGHKRVAYFGPGSGYSSSRIRYEGFVAACAGAGLDATHCPLVENTDAISIRRIRALFQAGEAPTAVVSASETHAVSAFDILTSLDLGIPDDIALVTLDGGAISPSAEVPLTALEFPGDRIGHGVAKTLDELDRKGQGGRTRSHTLREPARLVVRASCGARPGRYRHEYLRTILAKSTD